MDWNLSPETTVAVITFLAAILGASIGAGIAGYYTIRGIRLTLAVQERQHAADAEWRYTELFLREEIDALKTIRKAIAITYETSTLMSRTQFSEASDLYASQHDATGLELSRTANIAGAWITDDAVAAIAELQSAYLELRSIFLRQYRLYQADQDATSDRTLSTPEGHAAYVRLDRAFSLAILHTDLGLAPTTLQFLRGRPPATLQFLRGRPPATLTPVSNHFYETPVD